MAAYRHDRLFVLCLTSRLPILDGIEDPDEAGLGVHNGVLARYPRLPPGTMEYIQRQQCILAGTMLVSAKEDRRRLVEVSNSALRNVHSSQKLFALAECAYKYAVPSDGCPRFEYLLKTAYEIGLQVMKMTMNAVQWRRKDMTRWIVNCAMDLGAASLRYLLDHWIQYFLPLEAVTNVAAIVIQSYGCKMSLDFAHIDELNCCARNLALECIQRDPPGCALQALELCQSDPYAFEKAYELITRAASNGRINSQILFQVARFMETQTFLEHAYKLALQALKGVTVPHNGEQSIHLGDIHWVCSLAFQMQRADALSELITTVVTNIKCAPVLSEILRRCSSGHVPVPSLNPSLTPHHPYQDSRKSRSHKLPLDKPPLRMLLEAAIAAYCETTTQRLQHISPRHYSDFIEFLVKAQETFKLSPDGMIQFNALLEHMRIAYKGKKKLMCLIREKFSRETRLQ